jgi:hypothetical protein
MKNWVTALWRWLVQHKIRVALLLFLGVVMVPRPGRSQLLPDPCCVILSTGLSTISDLLKTVVATPLAAINEIQEAMYKFHNEVIWPEKAIGQARALVGEIEGIFDQAGRIFRLSIKSATLPAPQRLEQILLSRSAGQAAHLGTEYGSVYAQVPPPADAPPEMRDLIDMTDAVAQAAMKRSITIDAVADLEMQAADRISERIRSTAPGTAPMLEAEASAWLVRANAYTQAALAELMRLQAIELANSGAEIKFGVTSSTNMREDVRQFLKNK